MLLVEAPSPVQAQVMAGRTQVKAHMISAVLAVVAAANDWADTAAVAADPADPTHLITPS